MTDTIDAVMADEVVDQQQLAERLLAQAMHHRQTPPGQTQRFRLLAEQDRRRRYAGQGHLVAHDTQGRSHKRRGDSAGGVGCRLLPEMLGDPSARVSWPT
jgi:hypothetical protein